MNLLSALNRSFLMQELQTRQFDLVVIGGGITGAGIALDAASRGLKVALIEQADFASGTSSKSTKLIHGGLRYLKQFELGLVQETGSERATVHRLAPHLVTPEKMLLPLIKGGTYGKMMTALGLGVYDLLAGVSGDDRRKMLSIAATLEREPLLRKEDLLGGGFYAEYRTDDARLTIEVIKTAVRQSAVCANYVQATSFVYEKDQLVGVECFDQVQKQPFRLAANYVVNATGPWVDSLRVIDKSLTNKRLFLSKGVHIVVPHERFPLQNAVYFDVPDGRMIFAIPRNRVTYIGTTDTAYQANINRIVADETDVSYLLEATNAMFPSIELIVADVESSWAGVRPLIHEEGKSASEMSRKDEVFESPTGLISIAGGKLTGYRKMAERVVDLVAERYAKVTQKSLRKCHTQDMMLTEGALNNTQEVQAYQIALTARLADLALPEHTVAYLVGNYGQQTDLILEKMTDFEGTVAERLIRAELWFCVQQELTLTVTDFFNRRTGRLYFDLPSVLEFQTIILADLANYFQWTNDQIEGERAWLARALGDARAFTTRTP